MINRLVDLTKKTIRSASKDGITVAIKKIIIFLRFKISRISQKNAASTTCADVLFINGSFLEHPARYRVTHQREQLEKNGISTAEVFHSELNLDLIRLYRCFVFFRCPYSDTVGEFIKQAKSLNKRVIFDIDDLVIDTKYTSEISYLSSMSSSERKEYDLSIEKTRKTLDLCDYAITTTEGLKEELEKIVPNVYINRNRASQIMVDLSDEALKNKNKRNNVRIGYFSGSITHNEDVELILPALRVILEKYDNVELFLMGKINIPSQLKEYKNRIIFYGFVDWRELPKIIAGVDINIAPLKDTVFNRAKSENKWIEASLVEVPTVASNVGAFARMIENGETGLLCSTEDEWIDSLSKVIENEQERARIGKNARSFVKEKCTTLSSNSAELSEYIKSIFNPNILIVLPRVLVSGGVMVAIKHGNVLQKEGYDVTILNEGCEDEKYIGPENCRIPVIAKREVEIKQGFDKAIATLWSTLEFVMSYPRIGKRYYLVQNFEPQFNKAGSEDFKKAEDTYRISEGLTYVTISKWCQSWLKDKYNQESLFIPNGIDSTLFYPVKRELGKERKVRVLIEGNSIDKNKNVDESFRIANSLDKDRYEIWYLSYQGRPKNWYRVDRFLHAIPYEKVSEIYRQCDILIKTSVLESFSYPPLEMMATGGYVVVLPNDGNIEFLKDGDNCLFYEKGNVEMAASLVNKIVSDGELQNRLYEEGLKTVKSRNWKEIERIILETYR